MSFIPSASSSEKRALVGALLRAADKFIREGKLEDAGIELAKVREIDPSNAYAMAFEERITTIKKELEHPKETSTVKNQPGDKLEAGAPAAEPHTDYWDNQKTIPKVLVTRNEIQAKLEEEYKKKFALEIQKAEQHISESLRLEEEKHAAERAELLHQLQKERTKYKEQMEETFSKRLQEELKTAEDRLRSEYENQKKRSEEGIRSKMESEHKQMLREMEAVAAQERDALEMKEQQALSRMKQEMELELAERVKAELQRLKQTSKSKEEKSRLDLEKTIREQLQKEFETRSGSERLAIETKYNLLHHQLEESFKAKQQYAVEDSEKMIEMKIEEIRRNEEHKFEKEKQNYRHALEREYIEKIQAMLAEERRRQVEESQKALQATRTDFEKERTKLMEDEQHKVEGLRRKLREEMQEEVNAQVERTSEEIARNYEHKMSMLGIEVPRTKEQRLQIYQDRVRDAWSSGPLTMEKAQHLMELQDILELGFDEHSVCETEVRLQLYAEAVQQAILSGKIKPNDISALEELKSRFDITSDEAANVEPLILSAFQRVAIKAIILVADDDEALVEIIKSRLDELGYSAIGVTTLAEAMSLVETTTVDLILCDIQFKGEKGDGFTFFKFVQQKPHLRKIPFVLMSSLDEGLFIRTGVQLGVDDYLTKPLDLDLLVAVIEGKLKKYRMLSN
jgi:CheY-like chemotaxis protein